jgi:acetylornithine deacetylase/succinyl-diaminopimelate desuccinylase-like protein
MKNPVFLQPASLMTHMQALCKEIGPRPSTSEKERRAAEYVESTLRKLGITDLHRQGFLSPNSAGLVTVPAFAAGLLGVGLALLGGAWGKALGAILLLGSAMVFRQGILVEPTFFEKLISRWKSQNVIAKIPAAGPPQRTVYLVGHLDSQKQRFQFPPSPYWIMKAQTSLPIVAGLLGGLTLLLELLTGNFSASGWLWIVGAGFLYGLAGALYDEFQPHVEGANDNATAVSVLLGIAENLKSHPLQNTDVVLLFTGCEEVGCVGMEHYLREFAPSTENTFWIDIEMVGAGSLCYVTQHGISYLSGYQPHPRMVALADKVAQDHPELGFSGKAMTMLEEVATLRKHNYQALCLAGYDENGMLANWHRLSDRLENIQPEVLGRAAGFTWNLMKAIDQ